MFGGIWSSNDFFARKLLVACTLIIEHGNLLQKCMVMGDDEIFFS